MSNVQFQNVDCITRRAVGKIQTAENIRISVKSDIAEVLSVGIDNVINSYDVTDGEVAFYGKTTVKFLYNDGTALASSTYNADFTAAIQNDCLTSGTKMSFDVVTVDSKVDTNANTATLTVLLEISAYAYVSESVAYFAESTDAFIKKESLEVLQNADVFSLPMVVDEQLAASKTINTVLMAESNLCIAEYTNAENILHVTGSATVRLTYLSDGQIVTDTLPFHFDRELDATGIPQGQLKIVPSIRATKVRLDIAEDSDNTDFTVEISAVVNVECCTIGVIEVVTDAYGTNCDFDFQRQTVATTLPCGSVMAKKKTVATLPLESGKNVVTAVNVGALVTKCTSLEKYAQVEGIVYATALYQTETGIESARIEVPFIQNVEVDYLLPQCTSSAYANVVSFALSDVNGLEASAELCIFVDSTRDVTYNVIVDVCEKPFDKTQLPAIEVCLAHKGETVWELAKGLHMSEEDLLAVNPEISGPLEKDARVVVYNKI